MADIKKILEEERRKERDAIHSLPIPKSWGIDQERKRKANKILGFAPAVLEEFGKATNLRFIYKGARRTSYGECLATYDCYKKTSWRGGETYNEAIIIGTNGSNSRDFGFYPGIALRVAGHEYGNNEPEEEITEEWFARILSKEFG